MHGQLNTGLGSEIAYLGVDVLDLAVDIETGVDNLYGLNIRIHQDVERGLRAKVNIAREQYKKAAKREKKG